MVRPGALPVCSWNTMHCLCHRMYHNVCKYSYLPWEYKLLKTVMVFFTQQWPRIQQSKPSNAWWMKQTREDNPLIYLTAHTCEQHNSQALGPRYLSLVLCQCSSLELRFSSRAFVQGCALMEDHCHRLQTEGTRLKISRQLSARSRNTI